MNSFRENLNLILSNLYSNTVIVKKKSNRIIYNIENLLEKWKGRTLAKVEGLKVNKGIIQLYDVKVRRGVNKLYCIFVKL